MTERDPDIAVLATRLGLRQLNYRTFERPTFPESVAAAPDDPVEAPPAAIMDAEPEPAMPVRPPQPVMPPPMVTAPMPMVAMAPPIVTAPMPMVAMAPPMQFPLLVQALSHRAAPPQANAPGSAQPFLTLRHVIAETSHQAEY
ncbi:hypothetical protein [Neoroseomonas lacus]|uniref:Uncharacterized protein n=1 Tax=Neoroseomonas lacus TaxID=287609 RepID=A0A917KR09_9PROT|nr:hypothetical protein [Neoroseomonas lacus]GGJ22387.1 hypothetical protein GCM10011320_32070 [Neoroseomonas lacus]